MPFDPQWLVVRGWVLIGLIWCFAALTSKRSVRRMPVGAAITQMLVLMLVFALVFGRYFSVGFLRARFVPAEEWVRWVGCAVAMAGFLFTLSARYQLGRNWSGTVTVKENHTLVRHGPYAIVRHPIYTGITVALLGTAIVYGEVRCFIGVILALFEWKRKSLLEERFMIEQFGREYIEYRREVKALIPFVW